MKLTNLAKTFTNVTNVSQWNMETRRTGVQGKTSATNLRPSWIKMITIKRLSPALTKKEPALKFKNLEHEKNNRKFK